ncbi:hypothetical protein, variant [Fonticula alba]|uniref:Rhodanese domain-containing protein n=1 Tax=Fonticula alba TaxID=691883 RepID=A0A058YZF4_FONAL|nr:hypothetical protein, variant [Fonticula alba]KCV67370.1 hypothetical protein, variant [Fonticula alba]|eukprot:XP_009498226.1 hypothetical protein, variant [Fonticula alba]
MSVATETDLLRRRIECAEAHIAALEAGLSASTCPVSVPHTPCYCAGLPAGSTVSGKTGDAGDVGGVPKLVTLEGLTVEEIGRYSRQLLLPEFSFSAAELPPWTLPGLGNDLCSEFSINPAAKLSGQARLAQARVLLVGCGGLGAPAGLYLGACGLGELGLVDFDLVERSNLPRQIAFGVPDLGRSKAEALAEGIRARNPSVKTTVIREKLDRQSAIDLIQQYDIVLDATDNVSIRYALSDACVATGRVLVSGSALGWHGQLTIYNGSEDGPCYRCLHPRPPPPQTVGSCGSSGVVAMIPGLIGLLQALETVKLIMFGTSALIGNLLSLNGRTAEFRTSRMRWRRPPGKCLCAPLADSEAFAFADRKPIPLVDPRQGAPLPANPTSIIIAQVAKQLASPNARQQELELIRAWSAHLSAPGWELFPGLAQKLHPDFNCGMYVHPVGQPGLSNARLTAGDVRDLLSAADREGLACGRIAGDSESCCADAGCRPVWRLRSAVALSAGSCLAPAVPGQPAGSAPALSQLEAGLVVELLDVRPATHWNMAHLAGTTHVEMSNLKKHQASPSVDLTITLCRRGNESQRARDHFETTHAPGLYADMIGGFTAWANQVDPGFPRYF